MTFLGEHAPRGCAIGQGGLDIDRLTGRSCALGPRKGKEPINDPGKPIGLGDGGYQVGALLWAKHGLEVLEAKASAVSGVRS